MKIFQKDSDYAVRALIYLAVQGAGGVAEYISTTDLSKELGFPLNFLRRICSTLIKGEILETREGTKGGVRLVRSPDTITLREIIELFHGKPEISECMYQKRICPNRKTCVLRQRIIQIEDKLAAEFEAVTIQTLIDDILNKRKTPN